MKGMPWERASQRRSVTQRVVADDEIVGHGWIHIERMSDDHVWMNILGRTYNLRSERGKLFWHSDDRWSDQDE